MEIFLHLSQILLVRASPDVTQPSFYTEVQVIVEFSHDIPFGLHGETRVFKELTRIIANRGNFAFPGMRAGVGAEHHCCITFNTGWQPSAIRTFQIVLATFSVLPVADQ